jgi:hypothetical protein
VLAGAILLFAIFAGLGALARGYWDLVIYRTIAGLGLGGEFGIGMALVAEAWAPNQRARACASAACRLARHVFDRAHPRTRRLCRTLECRRAENSFRSSQGDAPLDAAAPSRQGRRNDEDQLRYAGPCQATTHAPSLQDFTHPRGHKMSRAVGIVTFS